MPIGPLIITINGMIRDFRPLLDYERKVDTSDLVPDGDYCLVEQLERAQYGVSMSHDAIIRKTVVTAIQIFKRAVYRGLGVEMHKKMDEEDVK